MQKKKIMISTKLIARHKEQEQLNKCLRSEQSEFVIVYGRRRIGKTFLIEQYFNKTVELPDNAATRGMIKQVQHLVKVEEA